MSEPESGPRRRIAPGREARAAWLLLITFQSLLAAPAAADNAAGIGVDSVAAARAALQGKPGARERIDPVDGWTLVDEAAIATQWAFAPSGHAAWPAVVRRVVKSGPQGIYIETRVLCEARKSACETLMQEVQRRNAVINQRLQEDPDLRASPGRAAEDAPNAR